MSCGPCLLRFMFFLFFSVQDVDWGQLDYLVIDTPPGTSDEHMSVVKYLEGCGVDGAVVVTTPQVKYYIIPLVLPGCTAGLGSPHLVCRSVEF